MTLALMSTLSPALLAGGALANSLATREIGGIELVEIPQGPFVMGSANPTSALQSPQPHWVDLSSFAIGRQSITIGQYLDLIDTNEPKIVCRPVGYKICNVSWFEASVYLDVLRQKTGAPLRMLSDAEWEKAARGPAVDLRQKMEEEVGHYLAKDLVEWVAKTSQDRFENFVTELGYGARIFTDPRAEDFRELLLKGASVFAWPMYATRSGRLTFETYQDLPGPAEQGAINAYGIKGMGGGGHEWVNDWHKRDIDRDHLAQKHALDPTGPRKGKTKVMRGGYWFGDESVDLEIARRSSAQPSYRDSRLGFRVAI